MTWSDQPSNSGSIAVPAAPAPTRARRGGWSLLWLGVALVAAMLLLAALGAGDHGVPGPPSVTVGTAAQSGDAA